MTCGVARRGDARALKPAVCVASRLCLACVRSHAAVCQVCLRHVSLRVQFKLMTSWALVADVYFLPPQNIRPDETAVQFAERVQLMIAGAAKLRPVPWDGYLKYYSLAEKVCCKVAQPSAGKCMHVGCDGSSAPPFVQLSTAQLPLLLCTCHLQQQYTAAVGSMLRSRCASASFVVHLHARCAEAAASGGAAADHRKIAARKHWGRSCSAYLC
jgi:hypothetical protein